METQKYYFDILGVFFLTLRP